MWRNWIYSREIKPLSPYDLGTSLLCDLFISNVDARIREDIHHP